MATDLLAAPYLAPGDNLTREEFIEIWERHPHIKRAELIGGVVYMPPALTAYHGDMETNIEGWIWYYRALTPGCSAGSNTTTYMLDDCPQPDVNLRLVPEVGGKARIEDDKYLHGLAELLAEICYSSAAYDLHQKLELYEEAGVPEYLAVIVKKKEIRWHRLVKGKFRLIAPDANGVYRSFVFPGLWLDSKALFKDDMAKVLKTLQKGIDSEEHQRFVEELARRKK